MSAYVHHGSYFSINLIVLAFLEVFVMFLYIRHSLVEIPNRI